MWTLPASISVAPAIDGLSITFLYLSTPFMLARLVSRKTQHIRFGADDWTMAIAWLSFVGLCTCLLLGTSRHTIGYPTGDATAEHNVVFAGKLEVSIFVVLITTLCFTKLSALCFYKCIFCIRDKRSTFRTIINISLVFVALWTITFFIFPLSVCGSHLEAYWTPGTFKKYCPTGRQYLVASSATDLIFEVWVIFLPIPKIWGLQTTVRRRLGVVLVFLTAFLSLATSIARLVITVYLITPSTKVDQNLGNSSIYFMAALEAGSGIVAVNMPSLWFLRKYAAPEKVLRSIRSVISLGSVRSAASKDSKDFKTSRKASTADGTLKSVRTEISAGAPESIEPLSEHEKTGLSTNIMVTSQLTRVTDTC